MACKKQASTKGRLPLLRSSKRLNARVQNASSPGKKLAGFAYMPAESQQKSAALSEIGHIRSSSNSQSAKGQAGEHNLVKDVEDIGRSFSQGEIISVRKSLLEWYDINHRTLPWRINQHSQQEKLHSKSTKGSGSLVRSPERRQLDRPTGQGALLKETVLDLAAASGVADRAYAVWVSEIMCQQTRIVVVVDYYKRWMQKWPSVADLAQATQEEVNHMWAGLGYYRRARFLLEGAKYIVSELDGTFPTTVPELLKVPGIGAYTAGAIASIAFGIATPVVDGNVVRVVSRLRAVDGDPTDKETVKLHWALAGQLVDPKRPGCFNQALMELGALVCTPTSPDCPGCPVSGQCRALKLVKKGPIESVTIFPQKKVKKAPREETVAVCVVEWQRSQEQNGGGRHSKAGGSTAEYLLVQRPATGLLAGLWEFPTVPVKPKASRSARLKALNLLLAKLLGKFEVLERHEIGDYVHVFSHIRQTMLVEKLVMGCRADSEVEAKEGRGVKRRKVEPKFNGSLDKLEEDANGAEASPRVRWVPEDEMESAGLTSGVRKVFAMTLAKRTEVLD